MSNELLYLLNDFIIEIIYKHNYFNKSEYRSIQNINNSSKIEYEYDDHTTSKNKIDVQHYTFYFLLEYIKNMTSNNNKTNRTQL
jgi:hypothetical protein